MPLSGKSSLGKKLKKQLSFPVFDLDAEIEKSIGKTVSEIFEKEGEARFREIESNLLHNLVNSHPQFLVVVGGGTPCYQDNASFMLENGNCLFMHTSIDEILKRSQTITNRPLLQEEPQRKLKALYEQRLSIYQKAHAEFFSEKEALLYFNYEC